jgi:predicted nucleic acid-binding protein
MKYVLDPSAALPWVLPEKDSAKGIRLSDDARNAVHDLIAPDIFPAEVFNSLLKAERTKRISVGDAKALYASIGADIPVLRPYLALMPRAGDIASRYRVALYDCLYIALAEREVCELITADRGITSLQSQFFFIVALSSL